MESGTHPFHKLPKLLRVIHLRSIFGFTFTEQTDALASQGGNHPITLGYYKSPTNSIGTKKTRTLAPSYSAEGNQVGKAEWSKILQNFDDATIYQTWSYGAVRWGENNLSHMVLKRDGEVVAVAQSRIMKFPVLKCGIAYMMGGPVWRLRGKKTDLENIRQMVRALREEYVVRCGLYLRVLPGEFGGDADADTIRSIFEEERFRWSPTYQRTLLLDLMPSLEVLRKGLHQKWRNCLNRAEKNGMEVIEGTDDKLYEAFSHLYHEMRDRKRFEPGVDVHEFQAIQKDLPEPLKMRIMVCTFAGDPVAALVGSLVGNTGRYLLGATGNNGLTLKGSYLLQWRMLEWLKECGACWYDLGGIDPQKNPGTYHFKAGLSGKSGREVGFIGQFDAYQSLVNALLVKVSDQLRMTSRKA